METLTLTTPLVRPSLVSYVVANLQLFWLPITSISVELLGSDGTKLIQTYQGAEAANLLTILNTANLTSNSLHKRIITKLTTDGVLAGTVTGVAG